MYKENYLVELAEMKDIGELEKLYNDLNDYLETGINYAGWKKGVYPSIDTVINRIRDRSLFVIKSNEEIVASVILNHKQDYAYSKINWVDNLTEKEILVVHTLVVSPKYMRQGIGDILLDFIKKYSLKLGIKSIRLDVEINNTPAISLYEKHGYKYKGTVDLGLVDLDAIWFRVYELKLY